MKLTKAVRWIVPLLSGAVFILALMIGIRRFGLPEYVDTVRELDGVWTYETDTGMRGITTLPDVVSLPAGTRKLRLSTTLPQWTGEAYAIHFSSMEQSVEVWVNGEKRYAFGGAPEDPDFVYFSAHHIHQVALRQEDSGGELEIIYRAPGLFILELGILREVQIGSMSDLALARFRRSAPYIVVSFLAFLTCLLSLVVTVTYRDMSFRDNLCMLLLAMASVAFYNLENDALWSVMRHSPVIASLADWIFYYLDVLVHFMALLFLYVLFGGCRAFSVKYRWQPYLFGMVYITAAILSWMGLFPFNLTRPFFMVFGFILLCVWVRRYGRHRDEEYRGFSTAVLVLLGGYYLDYIKYCLMILPMRAEWSVFLQARVPFQFFTGIALIVFSVLVLRQTLERLARHKADIKVEAATALLLAEQAKQQHESIMQRDMSLRRLRHDMQFHFRTAAALLAEGRAEDAERYLADIGDTAAALRVSSWCADQVADITIGWYADKFAGLGISFSADVHIPTVREEVRADLTCILSNALQNALEGCQGLEEAYVRLTAGPKGNDLAIHIENRCGGLSGFDTRDFPTTKTGEGHGLGIAGMKAAAARRKGYFNVCAEDGVFRVDVVLCGVFEAKGSKNREERSDSPSR